MSLGDGCLVNFSWMFGEVVKLFKDVLFGWNKNTGKRMAGKKRNVFGS